MDVLRKPVSRRDFLKIVGGGLGALAANEPVGAIVEYGLDIGGQIKKIEQNIGILQLPQRLDRARQGLSELGIRSLPFSQQYVLDEYKLFTQIKADYESRSPFIPLHADSFLHKVAIDESDAFFSPQHREQKRKLAEDNSVGESRMKSGSDVNMVKHYPQPGTDGYRSVIAKNNPSEVEIRFGYGPIPAHADIFLSGRLGSLREIENIMFGRYARALLGNLHVDIRSFVAETDIAGLADSLAQRMDIIDASGFALTSYGPHEFAHMWGLVNSLNHKGFSKNSMGALGFLPLDVFLIVADHLPEIIKEMDAHPEPLYRFHKIEESVNKLLNTIEKSSPAYFGGAEKMQLVKGKMPFIWDKTKVRVSTNITADFFHNYREISSELINTEFGKSAEHVLWRHMEEVCVQGVELAMTGVLLKESPRYRMAMKIVQAINPEVTKESNWLERLQYNTLLRDVRDSLNYVKSDSSLGQDALELLRKRVLHVFTTNIGSEDKKGEMDDFIAWYDAVPNFIERKRGRDYADPAARGVLYHLGDRETIIYLYHSPVADLALPQLLGMTNDEWYKFKNGNEFVKPTKMEKLAERFRHQGGEAEINYVRNQIDDQVQLQV